MPKKRTAKQVKKKKVLAKANEIAEGAEIIPLDLPSELTEQQRTIIKLKMRGLTQKAIADIIQTSQPFVSQELREIRDKFATSGKSLDQNVVVGESVNLFQEVEHRAWEIYYTADKDSSQRTKALDLVMSAREKSNKLLMDLGIIRRASTTHEHSIKLPPLMQDWEDGVAQKRITSTVIETQLTDLADPEPPQLPENIIEASYTTLDEPEPPNEE